MPISAVTKEMSFIGKGVIYLQPIDSSYAPTGAAMNIGNCSTLENSFDEEKQEQPNYMTPGGGNANVVSKISSFSGSLTMHDYTPQNLAYALRGTVTSVTSGAVADEAQPSFGVDGELIKVDFPIDHTAAVTAKLANDTALSEGVDFNVTSTGIVVIGAGAIDAAGVKISYTKAAGAIMEALVSSGQEFRMIFDGLNEAKSGDPVSIVYHRVKFSPASGLSFIGSEFGEIPLSFDVVADPTKVGGLSQYMTIAQAA